MHTSLAHLIITVLIFLTMLTVGMKMLGNAIDAQLHKQDSVYCQYEDGSYSFVDPDTAQPGCQ